MIALATLLGAPGVLGSLALVVPPPPALLEAAPVPQAPPAAPAPPGEAEPASTSEAPGSNEDGGTPSEASPSSATEPSPGSPPPPPTGVSSDAPKPPPPSEEAIARQNELKFGERTTDRFGRPGSRQRFALELKVGPYLPDVDRNYSGDGLGPYATLFGRTGSDGVANGEPKNAIMPAIAFDWQFYYLGGPFGIGGQVGFFRDRAKAILTNPTPEDDSVRSEADNVTFGVVPVAALLSYRFELLADRFKVPLVPYAKAGVSYGFWWTRNGQGNVPVDDEGERGAGGVWGFQLNGGMMLRLDFIERGTAKKLDQTTGINHTYVFGEFQYSQLDNFGIGNSISVGDATWFAGLAIEF